MRNIGKRKRPEVSKDSDNQKMKLVSLKKNIILRRVQKILNHLKGFKIFTLADFSEGELYTIYQNKAASPEGASFLVDSIK